MPSWTAADIPDLSGRTAVVTGANSGLGLETTRELARKGARVVMACRNEDKAERARAEVRRDVPDATVDVEILDLASLDSVRDFAGRFGDAYERLDVLYCNAGIMAIPRGETEDGFETQFGVNVLGHFALTGLLLDALLDTDGSRVVWLSSLAAWNGTIAFGDLQGRESYGRWSAYSQSKLGDLLLALEMNRRLQNAGTATLSVAAHPGFSSTNLQTTSAEESDATVEKFLYDYGMGRIAMSQAEGALSQLRAGTDPFARGGAFYGPSGGMRGKPVEVNPPKKALDMGVRAHLWAECERLTGVSMLSD